LSELTGQIICFSTWDSKLLCAVFSYSCFSICEFEEEEDSKEEGEGINKLDFGNRSSLWGVKEIKRRNRNRNKQQKKRKKNIIFTKKRKNCKPQ